MLCVLKNISYREPISYSLCKQDWGWRIPVFIGAFIGKAGIPVFTRVENLFLLKQVAMPVIILKGVRFAW
jgi:hypothetical protein